MEKSRRSKRMRLRRRLTLLCPQNGISHWKRHASKAEKPDVLHSTYSIGNKVSGGSAIEWKVASEQQHRVERSGASRCALQKMSETQKFRLIKKLSRLFFTFNHAMLLMRIQCECLGCCRRKKSTHWTTPHLNTVRVFITFQWPTPLDRIGSNSIQTARRIWSRRRGAITQNSLNIFACPAWPILTAICDLTDLSVIQNDACD